MATLADQFLPILQRLSSGSLLLMVANQLRWTRTMLSQFVQVYWQLEFDPTKLAPRVFVPNTERNIAVFSHVMIGSNDLDTSREFYDAIFLASGGKAGFTDDKGRLVYVQDRALFMVTRPIDGKAATIANGGTIGFALQDQAAVDAWHAAGLASGGQAIEDPPGIREVLGRELYVAYLRDPTGNKICGLTVIP